MYGAPMQGGGMPAYGGSHYGMPGNTNVSAEALYGPGPYSFDGQGGGEGAPCDDGSYGGGQGGHGHGHGHGLCPATDLWTDLHSHHRVYGRFQYINLWTEGNKLPPLVTTSPIGTPQDVAGQLGPGNDTQILFGNQTVDNDPRAGGRLDIGYWLVDGEFFGIEGHYFSTREASTDYSKSSTFSDGIDPTDMIIARPFINIDPNFLSPENDAQLVAFPDFVITLNDNGTPNDPTDDPTATVQLDGSVRIHTSSDLVSTGALFRQLVWVDFQSNCRLDALGGYRYFRYNDGIQIYDTITTVGNPLGDSTLSGLDNFLADNQIHAGELGLVGQWYCGPLSLELLTKVAIGNNRQKVKINGYTDIITDFGTDRTVGGLLTQPSNIGTYKNDQLAVMPELNLNVRLDVTRHLRAIAGYTLIYLNNIQTSGRAIDLTVNPTQFNGGTLDGEARPGFAFRNQDMLIHGFNVGCEYRW